MHSIRIFVLRLFVDSERPHCLRGALRSIPEDETYLFADEQALLALLLQMVAHANPGVMPVEISQDQGE